MKSPRELLEQGPDAEPVDLGQLDQELAQRLEAAERDSASDEQVLPERADAGVSAVLRALDGPQAR